MEPFIAQIMMFGGNFAPRGWAFCNGQLLSIAQNTALFSILGTTYGGDGRTTFGLPDLRGRAAVHSGNSSGPGLTLRSLGSKGGTENTTLTVNNMPTHDHGVVLKAESAAGDSRNPNGKLLAFVNGTGEPYANPVAADEVAMHPDSIDQNSVGGGQSFNNMMPYLAVSYIIALVGIFPSRN